MITTTGAVFTAVLLLSLGYWLTGGNNIFVFCGVFLTITFFIWGMVCLTFFQKKLAEFTNRLCQTLDIMMDGGDRERIDWEAETFLARISHRLERLYNILQTNRCKAEKEKNELQSLLSDISHQIKVPIANLKMVNETLSTRQVSAEKQREFLQISKSQLDKLDFLIQAMIKTSRLETGMLIFEKKSASLADTLSTALNGVLASMEKSRLIGRWIVQKILLFCMIAAGQQKRCIIFWIMP